MWDRNALIGTKLREFITKLAYKYPKSTLEPNFELILRVNVWLDLFSDGLTEWYFYERTFFKAVSSNSKNDNLIPKWLDNTFLKNCMNGLNFCWVRFHILHRYTALKNIALYYFENISSKNIYFNCIYVLIVVCYDCGITQTLKVRLRWMFLEI